MFFSQICSESVELVFFKVLKRTVLQRDIRTLLLLSQRFGSIIKLNNVEIACCRINLYSIKLQRYNNLLFPLGLNLREAQILSFLFSDSSIVV